MKRLQNKICIITGSSRGIGKAIAQAFALEGGHVIVTYHSNYKKAHQVVDDIIANGGSAIAHELKLESRTSVENLVEDVIKNYDHIDVLVNNAAAAQIKPFEEITDDDWDEILNINLRGTFICCQKVLPFMKKQHYGKVINISSIGGQWGGWMQVHYAVSKAGIIGLTKSLARIHGGDNININSISPGLVKTEMTVEELESQAGREKVANIPLKRVATVEEIASVAVFLASDESKYITGQTINVNGGMYFG